MIQNLKNFDVVFELNKIQIYEKIFKEGKKLISILQNIRKNIGQTNLFKTNYKTLNNIFFK